MEVALSLGSNLGDRHRNLERARAELAALPGVTLVACSRLYETDPVDVREQDADRTFLNAVVIVETALPPEELARAAHAIEDRQGRVRGSDRNAPRPLDIDLIYADSVRRDTPELRLPHPRWRDRRFVVQPLAELRPEARLPGESRTVREVLRDLPAMPGAAVSPRQWTMENIREEGPT